VTFFWPSATKAKGWRGLTGAPGSKSRSEQVKMSCEFPLTFLPEEKSRQKVWKKPALVEGVRCQVLGSGFGPRHSEFTIRNPECSFLIPNPQPPTPNPGSLSRSRVPSPAFRVRHHPPLTKPPAAATPAGNTGAAPAPSGFLFGLIESRGVVQKAHNSSLHRCNALQGRGWG